MKQAGFISTAVLFMLLGTIAPAYAQHEQRGNQQEKSQQGQQHPRPQSSQQNHEQSAQQHQQSAQQQHHQQQANRPAQHRGERQSQKSYGGVRRNDHTYAGVHQQGVPQHQRQVRSGFIQSRARSWNDEHRSWGQRGGYHGYRVPQDRYRLYFGNKHYFRMNRLPMTYVSGYPRFQYGGYWVTFVDPWPEAWAPTWYETDDVYIDYTNDGYYLYDRMRPGLGIAVTIAF